MANNIIADTVILTGSTQRLVDESLVFSFRLCAGKYNQSPLTVLLPNGGSYVLYPGSKSEWYKSVDLHGIQVIGTVDDTIVYDGGTW